ncbi:hypothetical protein [Methylorubrum rhodesianum]|jgi:hypothetical protein|uniref:hypothetical protein n=1 Tax=Methylorubrum rhodesianum TaxID=29427 RepID=UPI003746F26A
MLAISDFRPGRVGFTVADILAKLRGLVPREDAEPVPPTPEERAANRDEAGRKLAAIESERNRELPRLAEVERRAAEHLQALTPAFLAAQKAHSAAQAALFRRDHDFRYAAESLRRQIEASHEPIIDEFIDDLYRLFHANIEQPRIWEQRGEWRDPYTRKRIAEIWDNSAAQFARTKAILALRDQAEAMKSDPDQTDIENRLAALLLALPDGNELAKVV